MKQILGVLFLVVAVVAPTQIVLAEEHYESFFPVQERLVNVQAHVGECQTMVMKMMETGMKLPPDKRAKMLEVLEQIDALTKQLVAIGSQ
ncbi:MAG: hypothetical protein ACE5MG_12840 [Candidatus Methylomirabilales bacterium]